MSGRIMKIEHEIFDHWWEYFVVMWWSIFAPSDEKLLSRKIVAQEEVSTRFKVQVDSFVSDANEQRMKEFDDFVDKKMEEENQRKTTIESKAHSLLGQTGVAVSLLAGALSLGTPQFGSLHIVLKIVVWLFFLAIILNFAVAGLHARNAVTIVRGYQQKDMDSFLDKSRTATQAFIAAIYASEYNSYLNDVKGTYLRFAHWYYKASFVIVILAALTLPPLITLLNPCLVSEQDKRSTDTTNQMRIIDNSWKGTTYTNTKSSSDSANQTKRELNRDTSNIGR